MFAVPGNGQVVLGMPDIDVLNIIKININSIATEDARDSDKQCANMHAVWESEPKQETDRAEKCKTNMDSISKLRDNKESQQSKQHLIKQQSISFQVLPMKVTGKRVLNLHDKYLKTLVMCLMVLGVPKTHFHHS